MDSCSRKKSIKRKRSDSSSAEDEVCLDKSKAWDDPILLEEMGLGILGSDVYTSDEGELKELLESSEGDDNENVHEKAVTHPNKKVKTTETKREPLKEQQVIIKNYINQNDNNDDDKALRFIDPNTCKALKTVNKTSNVGENENDNHVKSTEDICKNDFKLSRIPLKKNEMLKDYFSQLPDELILCIFSKLDRASVVRCCKVSRLFNRVANDESLWNRIDLTGRNLAPYSLGYMMRRDPFIVRLASASINDPVCHKNFPVNFICKIQYLDLSMASISEAGLAKLLSHCTRLKKLSVENCQLNDKVAEAIAGNRGLEVLNLAMCTGLTAVGINHILTQCQRLQSLNLGWTNLGSDAVSEVARLIPASMERLNISGCRKKLSDKNVIEILKRCENLLELDVSDSIELTEVTINYIAKKVSTLEYLAISRCYNIPIEGLCVLKNVPSLTYLDLFGMCSEWELKNLRGQLEDKTLNQFTFSSVARPTVGIRRSSIWGLKVKT